MSIKFHCSHCNKLIRAPAEAGGKHGKCPNCQQSVYVPMPSEDLEEISVAPLDAEAERHRREAEEEDRRIRSEAAREVREPPQSADRGGAAAETAMPPPRPESLIDVPGLIVRFVMAMRDSKLDQADRIAAELGEAAGKAKDEIQRLMVDEIPPPGLEDVPPALCKGFLRALLDRI